MATDKIPITYELVGKEIHKRQGEDYKIVATYEGETKTLTFPNTAMQRWNSEAVNAFLAQNELLVQNVLLGTLPKDPPLTKAIPPRPKKGPEGDKTPEIVAWYRKYRPNQFIARYGVLGNYTGKVVIIESRWKPRPGDGILEYRGPQKIEKQVTDVLLARRATCLPDGTRLTYTPEECVEWHEDEDQDLAQDTAVEDNQ